MLVVTTENLNGYEITEVYGTAFGIVVRARNVFSDIGASLKGLVGGEIKGYTKMVEDSRKQALERLIQNAQVMGANAVVMMRFDNGDIGQNMSEVVAYGTAVKVRPKEN